LLVALQRWNQLDPIFDCRITLSDTGRIPSPRIFREADVCERHTTTQSKKTYNHTPAPACLRLAYCGAAKHPAHEAVAVQADLLNLAAETGREKIVSNFRSLALPVSTPQEVVSCKATLPAGASKAP